MLWPGFVLAAWGLCLLMCRGGGAVGLAVLVSVLAVLGGPAANYLAWEFLPVRRAWLWNAWPATFAWSASASRLPAWLPQPYWALALWPAVGLALIFLTMLLPACAGNPTHLRKSLRHRTATEASRWHPSRLFK